MKNTNLSLVEAASETVYAHLQASPQICWPLLCARAGCEVYVKHENHNPTGAFKVRGGLTFMQELKWAHPNITNVITATRGNHGQSISYAAARMGLKATIVVPDGNNPESSAAMRAYGADVVEHDHDFQAAYEHCEALGNELGAFMVHPFNPWLLKGVSTYAWELFTSVPDLDAVYVPIGLGSGICSTIAMRDALGLKTEVIGVNSENAPAYALSFDQGKPVSTETADTIADGIACRVPIAGAVERICAGASRIVQVSDAQILDAMSAIFSDTRNLAEGAGAAPFAALLKEKDKMKGKKVAFILSGGNCYRSLAQRVLAQD